MTGEPGVLPLRPLTAGELFDAAVSLLRSRGLLLGGLGVAVAAAEQAVLFPLRRLADLDLRYLPADDRWSQWALLVTVGFVLELLIIAGLGAVASRIAPAALLGPAAPRPARRARRAVAAGVAALLVAGAGGLVAATGFGWPATFFLLALLTVPLWAWLYGSLGLVVPAVVIDGTGPVRAFGRSVRLSSRGMLRTVRLRVSAYVGWFVLRLAWGAGVLSLIGLVYTPPGTVGDNLLMAAVYCVVNALAYPTLACLDVVLHLEARMRTEGLDIALRRSLSRGTDPAPVLAVR